MYYVTKKYILQINSFCKPGSIKIKYPFNSLSRLSERTGSR